MDKPTIELENLSKRAIEAQKLVEIFQRDDTDLDLEEELEKLVLDLAFAEQLNVLKYSVLALFGGDLQPYGTIEDYSAISDIVEAIGRTSMNRCLRDFEDVMGIQDGDEAYFAFRSFCDSSEPLLNDNDYKKKNIAILIEALQKTHDAL